LRRAEVTSEIIIAVGGFVLSFLIISIILFTAMPVQ